MITYLFIIPLMALIALRLKTYLAIFQQEHYDWLKFIKGTYFKQKHDISMLLNYAILIISGCYYLWAKDLLLIASIILILLSFLLIKPLIIPLKYTKRVIRLIITFLICFMVINCTGKIVSFVLISSFCLVILPWLIIIANLLNYPIEQLIRNKFINEAKQKLKTLKLFKIAITGSYGKTSTKNIINSLLENFFLTLPTPKSYNTPLGIAKTINELLSEHHEIFVVEMGAFRKKEISYLTNFIVPDIGILTDVGPQHLTTFKNIETVLETKMELFQTNDVKVAIMNFDNPLIKNYAKAHFKTLRIVGYGINEEGVDYQAKEITINQGKTSFDFYQKGKYIQTIKINLVGRHNIYNLLAGLACIIELNKLGFLMSFEEVIKKASSLKNPPHRLAFEKRGNWDIYDDSFNANIVGFTNAIEVLKMSNVTKVIITPGIVDAGKELSSINRQVAKLLIGINEVYLVDNEASRFIEQFFIDERFNNYVVVNSFKMGYQMVLDKYQDKNICLLIENDLPDNFLRRK